MHIASLLTSLVLGLFGAGLTNPPATDKITANHPVKVKHNSTSTSPQGLSVAQIRSAYGLTNATGGHGTIALIDAYDYPTAATDLNASSIGLLGSSFPACSTTTGACFEKHKMATRIRTDSGWALESALDTQWAHAIAPSAHILLVEAKSASLSDLLSAVNYARSRSDVVAVSMSWGAGEFSSEASYDSYFTSSYGASFFASTGDNGHGVSWPSVSGHVTAVGGTTLNMSGINVISENTWNGSGGGISAYEPKPAYQANVPAIKRSVPDVSYNANPDTGVSVYDTTSYNGLTGWWIVGGTSAGAPQWAAIRALGASLTNDHLYSDVSSNFRDITAGPANGTCGSVCTAAPGYDFVTGLGSPLTSAF
jgi:subtilase family serine protease